MQSVSGSDRARAPARPLLQSAQSRAAPPGPGPAAAAAASSVCAAEGSELSGPGVPPGTAGPAQFGRTLCWHLRPQHQEVFFGGVSLGCRGWGCCRRNCGSGCSACCDFLNWLYYHGNCGGICCSFLDVIGSDRKWWWSCGWERSRDRAKHWCCRAGRRRSSFVLGCCSRHWTCYIHHCGTHQGSPGNLLKGSEKGNVHGSLGRRDVERLLLRIRY